MQKRIILWILYLVVSISYWYYLYQNYEQKKTSYQEQILSGSNIVFSGNIFSWSNISTWVVVNTWITLELAKSELQKFEELKKDWFLRVFNPPKQPSLIWLSSYQLKSNILNNYLKENNYYFQNSLTLTDGYLYIKLVKPIKKYDVFLYFHDSLVGGHPMSWKIAKEDNLIIWSWSSQEFLFKLSNISIYRYYDGQKIPFNWLDSTLKNASKIHFIWGYTTGSDWNQIEEIIITWK